MIRYILFMTRARLEPEYPDFCTRPRKVSMVSTAPKGDDAGKENCRELEWAAPKGYLLELFLNVRRVEQRTTCALLLFARKGR
jgi:hypothetical protein